MKDSGYISSLDALRLNRYFFLSANNTSAFSYIATPCRKADELALRIKIRVGCGAVTRFVRSCSNVREAI